MRNLKLLIIFIFLVTSCSEQNTTEQLLVKANSSLTNGENKTAIIHLKKALSQQSNSTEARFLLGKAYLESGDFLPAKKEIERALKLSKNNKDFFADYYRVLNEVEDEELVLTHFSKQSTLTDQAKLHASYAALKINDIKAYNTIYTNIDINKLTPQDANFSKLLLMTSKQNNDGILAEFSQKLTITDISIEGMELLGHLFSRQKEYALAIQAYEIAFDIRPKHTVLMLLIAQNQIQNKEFDNARPNIHKLLKLFPKHGFINQLAGQLAIYDKNFELAKSYSTVAIQSGLSSDINLVIAGLSSYQLNMLEQAKTYLTTVSKNLSPSNPVQKILAATNLKLGFTNEAVKQLSDISIMTEDDFSLLTSASINLMQNNEIEKAKNLLKKVDSPKGIESPSLLNRLGILKLSANDLSGMDYLYKSIEIDDDSYSTKAMLVSSLIATNNTKEARKQVKKWLKTTPEDVNLLNILAYIDMKDNKPEAAKNIFSQILRISATDIKANMFFGVEAFKKQDYSTAIKSFKAITDNQPSYLPALLGYYLTEKALGETSNAFDLIKSQAKGDVRIKLLQAKILISDTKLKDAISLLNTFQQPNKIAQVEELKTSAYLNLNDKENALASIKNWRTIKPSSEKALIKQLAILEINKAYELGLTEIKVFKRNFATYSLKLDLLEINFNLFTKNINSAVEIINKLKETTISQSLLTPYEARVEFNTANYKTALPLLKDAYSAESNALFAQLIFTSLSKLGETDQAIDFMENRVNKYTTDSKSRMLLADKLVGNNTPKAIEHYKILSKQLQNNSVILNNLAWLLHEQGKPSEGLIFAEKAIALAPDNKQIQNTLNQIKKAI